MLPFRSPTFAAVVAALVPVPTGEGAVGGPEDVVGGGRADGEALEQCVATEESAGLPERTPRRAVRAVQGDAALARAPLSGHRGPARVGWGCGGCGGGVPPSRRAWAVECGVVSGPTTGRAHPSDAP